MAYWVHLIDHWIALVLLPLTLAVLLMGVDDLILNIIFVITRFLAWRTGPAPELSTREPGSNRSIAILVPCWGEAGVIVTMVEHNMAVVRYPKFEMFVGVYPNDEANVRVVRELETRFPRVHIMVGPKNGPSYKGDNLNCMFQALYLWEERHGVQFDAIITHDAEDMIHPDALAAADRYLDDYDMVQIPVLPKPTQPWEWTHGVYCDEFAEFQRRDMPVRSAMGSFLPSNGVGTGYTRQILEKLAAASDNCLFAEGCLTEDYEIGLRLHRLGCKQIFVPLQRGERDFVATRELFPQTIKKALKQRTRWVIGITLQTWERYGWRGTMAEVYWFWRDRRGLWGNPLSFFCNVVSFVGILIWSCSLAGGQRSELAALTRHWTLLDTTLALTLGLALLQFGVRTVAVRSVYGGRFASLLLIRTLHANWMNAFCTFRAVYQYFQGKWLGKPLQWSKTEHVYPTRGELRAHRRLLGEILVGSGLLNPALLHSALATCPQGTRIGEHLVRTGKISDEELYLALSLQQSLPVGWLEPGQISRKLARALPRRFVDKWQVLPYRVMDGSLFLASPEVPTDELSSALRDFTPMRLSFRLVTPRNFEELKGSLL